MNQQQPIERTSNNPEIATIVRGMPRWRGKQRSLPVGEKIELIGRFIRETRQLELFKKSCKLSATCSNNFSVMGR
jgi:hypothetical protein